MRLPRLRPQRGGVHRQRLRQLPVRQVRLLRGALHRLQAGGLHLRALPVRGVRGRGREPGCSPGWPGRTCGVRCSGGWTCARRTWLVRGSGRPRCTTSTSAGPSLHEADLTGADLRGSVLTALDPLTARLGDAVVDLDQAVVLARALGLRVEEDVPLGE
nr:hypothetical protein [Nocardioides convexus]